MTLAVAVVGLLTSGIAFGGSFFLLTGLSGEETEDICARLPMRVFLIVLALPLINDGRHDKCDRAAHLMLAPVTSGIRPEGHFSVLHHARFVHHIMVDGKRLQYSVYP